ncbi:MAG TPA: hypothetical protein VHT91_13790 [Kofleriaceae bacterium]|jgi:hypothetical protein|nr:hypothetical protein [Kofleriaceae bacterium]
MGQLELFAQRTFAEETERITEGAARWQDPPEIRLEKVTSDGLLVIHRSHLLKHLAAPWPEALPHGEVMIELKLAGNHLDRKAVARALLRRQAREVQRLEEEGASWRGEEPLWLVAPHVPRWLRALRRPVRFAPGCYRIDPYGRSFLWIAANELPLLDELVPFLLARSGQALDDFSRWVAPRRPPEWMIGMLNYLPMSIPTREELLSRLGPSDDPEIEARRQHMIQFLLERDPKMKQQLQREGQLEGRLTGTRASLRRVLAGRQLTPSKDDDARIEACTDLATLERWLDRAITAASVSDVLG